MMGQRMRRFLRGVWRVIAFPFRALWWIITLPFRTYRAVKSFMLTEPEEHPLGDVFADLTQSEQARQLFWDQIEALRGHLLRAVLGIMVGVAISFAFTDKIVNFLAIPVGGLQALKAIEVTESIGVFMNVALLSGLAISLPYVAFEFWFFAAPGLRPRERMFGLVGIPLAAIFFIGGIAFTYYLLLPSALPFLLNFLGIQAQLRPSSYFSFITGLMFWIGMAFEFPLVIYVLTSIGFIRPNVLAKQWRIAVVIIAVAAAAITPTVDPVNMGLVMLPMIGLYFISIGLSYIAYNGRRNPSEKKDVEEGSQ
jgi:sec-independent protein translocase protein TatC